MDSGRGIEEHSAVGAEFLELNSFEILFLLTYSSKFLIHGRQAILDSRAIIDGVGTHRLGSINQITNKACAKIKPVFISGGASKSKSPYEYFD